MTHTLSVLWVDIQIEMDVGIEKENNIYVLVCVIIVFSLLKFFFCICVEGS
jgi:hypothetical protein